MESGANMKIVKNIIVAFSLYSQIPMPRFQWTEEDRKHNLVFLPWVGAVIGAFTLGLYYVLQWIEAPLVGETALFALVPLLITGGFHVDGYMDVQDALKSYKSPEEKLEILKDPHIGAFAVIRLLIYSLIWGAAMSVLIRCGRMNLISIYSCTFFIARAGAALTSLSFIHAKKTGMLHMETEKSTSVDSVVSALELMVGLVLVCMVHRYIGFVIIVVTVLHCLYYRRLCYRNFGGVTGDTAGFYIVTLEEVFLVTIAVLSYFI